jgi:hypothetical protein
MPLPGESQPNEHSTLFRLARNPNRIETSPGMSRVSRQERSTGARGLCRKLALVPRLILPAQERRPAICNSSGIRCFPASRRAYAAATWESIPAAVMKNGLWEAPRKTGKAQEASARMPLNVVDRGASSQSSASTAVRDKRGAGINRNKSARRLRSRTALSGGTRKT